MQKHQDAVTIIGPPGLIPIVGANVTVWQFGSSTNAVIYSSNSTTSPTGNPLTTDSNGQYSFYAANGHYSVQASGTGIQTSVLTDIILYDPADAFQVTTGASNIGFIQGGTGAVATDLQTKNRQEVSAFDFMTTTQIADVQSFAPTSSASVSIQKALDYLVTKGGGILSLPEGNYLIDVPLNLADKITIPLTIQGQGTGVSSYNATPVKGSNFYGKTGTQAVIEAQGSQSITLRDFGIYSLVADASRSAVGIFIGRTAASHFAQFHSYTRLGVYLATNSGANASRGSIALYNLQGEHGIFDDSIFAADTPMELMDNNVIGYTPTYGALFSLASCAVNSFRQVAFLATDSSVPFGTCELWGIQSTNFIDCYWGLAASTPNFTVAVNLRPNANICENIKFIGGQIEYHNTFLRLSGSTTQHLTIDTSFANSSASGPLIAVDQNNGAVFNLDAHFGNLTGTNYNILGVGVATGVSGSGSLKIENNIRLSASAMRFNGIIEDYNIVASSVVLASGSDYHLHGLGSQTISSNRLSLSASTIGFFNISATTQPNVSSVINTSGISSTGAFGFSSQAQAQSAFNGIRDVQLALKQLGLSS